MSEIKGLKELNQKLEKLKGIKTSKALLAGAYKLQQFSMENSPVKTGFLKSSHYSEETDTGAQMVVGANYAYYQEFGTDKIPAKGFVRRAIEENPAEILQAISTEISKEIKNG